LQEFERRSQEPESRSQDRQRRMGAWDVGRAKISARS